MLVYKEPLYDEERELIHIYEWKYDEEGKRIWEKDTEGHEDTYVPGGYYEVYRISQYNESGEITEYIRQIMVLGKEYTVSKKEYQYDDKGRLVEESRSAMIDSTENYRCAIRCASGENTELYITDRYEFKYSGSTIKGRIINYKYEANKDFSVVNLTETREGEWMNIPNGSYWTITYYTEEEVEKYFHDKEFSTVN